MAPFKRNTAMLEVPPIDVMISPGTGIEENSPIRRAGSAFPSGGSARERRFTPLAPMLTDAGSPEGDSQIKLQQIPAFVILGHLRMLICRSIALSAGGEA